jgi:alkanesulfonate monooxygenase SsuD/methylene tetrahydromethanopterin reductase-like flavin-dependent oxidoreductase (luciferase family)
MTMVGEPNEIADRLIAFQRELGHTRQILQMDLGGIPHREVLRSIELLGTEVAPKVRAALG